MIEKKIIFMLSALGIEPLQDWIGLRKSGQGFSTELLKQQKEALYL